MEHFFETVTPYDQKALRDFAKIHYRRTHLVMLALLPLLGGLLLLVGVGSLLLPFSELGAGAWLLVAAGGALLLLEGRLLTGRVAVRASTPEAVPVYRLRFYPDRVEYASRQTQGFYYYHQLIRALEGPEYFYLYTSREQALLVGKAGMTLGEPWQLREFLAQTLGPRFKP